MIEDRGFIEVPTAPSKPGTEKVVLYGAALSAPDEGSTWAFVQPKWRGLPESGMLATHGKAYGYGRTPEQALEVARILLAEWLAENGIEP